VKPPEQWEIPPKVWGVLFSLILAVSLIFTFLTANNWINEHENRERDDQLRKDLCALITVNSIPTPIPTGSAGDRTRSLLPKVEALKRTTCEEEHYE
jgi:hypothetical protein